MKMNLKKKYVFNPFYILIVDNFSPILKSKSGWIVDKENMVDSDFSIRIHPMHAIIFTIFDGKSTLDTCLNTLSNICKINRNKSLDLIKMFIENSDKVGMSYAGRNFTFPKNILISMSYNYSSLVDEYNYKDFLIEKEILDFTKSRFSYPTNIFLIINNVCCTDCNYCYAYKETVKKSTIPLSRIIEIIHEARDIGSIGFDISGGEFFLYEHWEVVLNELINCGFKPYISTKVPLLESDVIKIKKSGLKGLQISLDSIDSNILSETIKVKEDYFDKMKNTLFLLEKYELEVNVHAIVTSKTATIKNITDLIDFISIFNNIVDLRFDAAARSLNLPLKVFNQYKIDAQQIKLIKDYINERSKNVYFNLICPIESNKMSLCGTKEQKNKSFNSRGKCSGNMEALVILPDGNVTICEELYWNDNFILGNIINENLMNIWNSPKSIDFKLDQKYYPKDSVCSSCDEFLECRTSASVCWRDIISCYGESNWEYPDPRCPQAPKILNNIVFGD